MARAMNHGQIDAIIGCVEEESHVKVECSICGESQEEEGFTARLYGRYLYDRGWRYAESKKFQLIGIMCPKCFNTPDEQRGED